jgi:hypothetical protein
MSSSLLIGCKGNTENVETPPTTKEQTPQKATPQVTVTITKINDTDLKLGQVSQVGREIIVEGMISDPRAVFCVLLHPLASDSWWVQNLPAPPSKINETTWRWRNVVWCGAESDLNKDFEIVAIVESQRVICQFQKTIKMEELPLDLPRSEVITVRRVRN